MRKAKARVRDDVAALAAMSLAELRTEWERRYGAAPRHRSADLLRRVLAWRIQADIHGGFDAPTRRLLENGPNPVRPSAAPGERLAREWEGRRYEVIVLEDGVLFEQRKFRSLSEVARHITGMRWNGPRFFGLRQANAR
ncbi:DUF2924 domain-containing protein [Novosphingobium sp.]|uniref:DUF2924 domain-containing protein n=1 Tax=Novosphingobium sp. TaxID=1874826 RepID=UPI0035B3B6A9